MRINVIDAIERGEHDDELDAVIFACEDRIAHRCSCPEAEHMYGCRRYSKDRGGRCPHCIANHPAQGDNREEKQG